jgi:glutathione S-transferase
MTESPLFELGVSCPRCYHSTSDAHKQRARERQKQFRLAQARGQSHLGQAQVTASKPVALPLNVPVLYSFRRCPYAMRARLALWVSGQRCVLREVALAQKPEAMLKASPKGTVPVLVTSEGVIDESLDIMLWALQQNDPQAWLPQTPHDLSAVLPLIRASDTVFKQHLDRYKYPSRFGLLDGLNDREKGADFLTTLEQRLTQHAFLNGDRWGLADVALAPFVRQFAHVDRPWFESQAWPLLNKWLQSFEQSTAYKAIMHKYKVWHPDQPSVVFPHDA